MPKQPKTTDGGGEEDPTSGTGKAGEAEPVEEAQEKETSGASGWSCLSHLPRKEAAQPEEVGFAL